MDQPLGIAMTNLNRYFLVILQLTGLACVIIVCVSLIYGVFSIATSRYTLGLALFTIGLRDLGRTVVGENDPAPQDMQQRAVEADHNSISDWVLDCT